MWRRVSDPPQPSAAQAGKDTCPYVDMNDAGPYVLVRASERGAVCLPASEKTISR